MILITGATGFIGKALTRQLVEMGYQVRVLIRPSSKGARLPKSIPLDVTVSTLSDERGIRGAMSGVEIIFHLAGSEWKGTQASLMKTDIEGTNTIVESAKATGVKRIIYVSHLGADRASAYPVLKAKAIAEEIIRKSGLGFTIFRTAIIYGPGDGITTGISALLNIIPWVFVLPGDGSSLLQPLWIEDLIHCLVWSLEDQSTHDRTYEIGGPEYFTFKQMAEMIMSKKGINKRLISMPPPYLRWMTAFLVTLYPGLPVSVYWLDYLAHNRTCALDTIPKVYKFLPSRFSHKLDYITDI